MRIIKGSKVEVWTQDAAAPVGAWRGGEVSWGNGHSYTLRWFDGGPESDRIPRKCVRPCPPPFALPADLAAGDMVEVLDDCLWKCAEVVSAGGGDGQLDVKIVGSTRVVTVALDMLRVRQALREDDVWVAFHKGNEIPRPMEPPSRRRDGGKFAAPTSGWKVKKRGYMVDIKNLSGNSKRLCVKEESLTPSRYDDNFEVVYVNPTTPLTKQGRTSGEDCDVVGAGGNSDGGAMSDSSSSSSSGSTDSSSTDSSSSSSSDDGAASATNAPRQDRLAAASAANTPRQDRQDAGQPQQSCKEEEHPDSATGPPSLVGVRGHQYPPSEVVRDEGERRRLQMHAYISLMRSFHAAGSLSWEKEELLSDMRLHLNISCYEHLQVIRDLNGRGKPGRLGGS